MWSVTVSYLKKGERDRRLWFTQPPPQQSVFLLAPVFEVRKFISPASHTQQYIYIYSIVVAKVVFVHFFPPQNWDSSEQLQQVRSTLGQAGVCLCQFNIPLYNNMASWPEPKMNRMMIITHLYRAPLLFNPPHFLHTQNEPSSYHYHSVRGGGDAFQFPFHSLTTNYHC